MIHGKRTRSHPPRSFTDKMRVLVVTGTCLILAAALAISWLQTDHEKEIMDTLSMECMIDGQCIRIGLWEEETDGQYYLFLPACFKSREKEFVLRYDDGKGALKIDGTVYKEGELWKAPEQEEISQIELTGPLGASYMKKTLQVLVSENLPAMMLFTEDEEELLSPKESAGKKYIETGAMVLLDENGNIVCNNKLEKLKVRGNLTATLAKKPFTFSLDTPIGLCGMKPAVKWNLLANATDGSCIRNKVVLDLANESTSVYEPDAAFTELYLNGRYQGLYLLTEAVEIGENRLDISPDESWFLEIELDFRMEDDSLYVITDRGQIFAVNSKSPVSESETEQIRFMLNDIESALFAEDGISALSGKPLEELLDLGSWADAWLIQEIAGDHDTGIASQFAYTANQKKEPLYAGPVWDFDGTMGNVNTPMFTNPSALTTSIESTREEGNVNQNRWLAAMYRHPAFQKLVEEKYKNNFRENLEEMYENQIDRYVSKISRSAVLDAFRWNRERLSWMFVLPEHLTFSEEGDYTRFAALDCHVDMVRDFLQKKKDFLDRLWIEHREFCVVEVRNNAPFLNQDYNQTIYYWIEKGSPIENLPCMEQDGYHFQGYFNQKSGSLVTNRTPITEDCILEGVWSRTE